MDDNRLFDVADVKRCSTCREIKPLAEYNRRTAAPYGHQPACRACNAAYHRANWHRHMAQIKARAERRRAAARAFVIEYLREHPCVDCGEADIVVLEFDHLRDKRANVGSLIGTSEIWRIQEEIAKCEVVCANCHRRRTAARANSYRHRDSGSWRVGVARLELATIRLKGDSSNQLSYTPDAAT